jgi:hypothetical protein
VNHSPTLPSDTYPHFILKGGFTMPDVQVTSEREQEEVLTELIGDHFNLIMKDFRILAKQTVRKESVQDVWNAFYQVYVGLNPYMPHVLADIARQKEIKQLLET